MSFSTHFLSTQNNHKNTLRMRPERAMPQWVMDSCNQRIGPPPPPVPNERPAELPPNIPPKKNQLPDPDYEVIEFGNGQTYSNAMPTKQGKGSGGLTR